MKKRHSIKPLFPPAAILVQNDAVGFSVTTFVEAMKEQALDSFIIVTDVFLPTLR
ncbi:hypothetical protein ALCH109712_04045 [Alkalicoccus chagannorensis]